MTLWARLARSRSSNASESIEIVRRSAGIENQPWPGFIVMNFTIPLLLVVRLLMPLLRRRNLFGSNKMREAVHCDRHQEQMRLLLRVQLFANQQVAVIIRIVK